MTKRTESPSRLPARVQGKLILLSLFACLVACDGYPTEDAPSINPFELTNVQRVSVLNELARRLESESEFSLDAGCLLQVETPTGWFSTTRQPHALSSVSFELRRTADPDAPYAVAFVGPERASSTVLSGRSLLSLQRAVQLLSLIKRDCSGSTS